MFLAFVTKTYIFCLKKEVTCCAFPELSTPVGNLLSGCAWGTKSTLDLTWKWLCWFQTWLGLSYTVMTWQWYAAFKNCKSTLKAQFWFLQRCEIQFHITACTCQPQDCHWIKTHQLYCKLFLIQILMFALNATSTDGGNTQGLYFCKRSYQSVKMLRYKQMSCSENCASYQVK